MDIDYHIHTNFSNDCKSSMETMVKAAIAREVKEIALTDHVDYKADGSPFPYQIDYKKYIAEFNRIQRLYGNRISIVLGVEVGIGSHLDAEIHSFLDSFPFQVTIGSIHDVVGLELHSGDFFTGKDKRQAYEEYFSEMLISLRKTKINLLGHMDYITRYGNYPDRSLLYSDYSDMINDVLREIIYSGKGLELNTSGIRYNLGQLHPQLDILKRYRKLGGVIITTGSDAHHPREIAHSFKLANEYLDEAEFKYISIFRDQKPFMVRR